MSGADLRPTRWFGAEARAGTERVARKDRWAERGRRGTAGKRHQTREMGFSPGPEDRSRFGQDSMPLSGTVAVPGWQYGAILRTPALGSALHRSRSKHIKWRFWRFSLAGFRACILDSAGILGVISHDLKASAPRLRRSNGIPRQKWQKSRAFFDLGVYSAGVWE